MTIIEFFGMPRTGKTSQISALRGYFEKNDISFLICGRPRIRFKDTGSLEEFHNLIYAHLLNHFGIYSRKKPDFLVYDRGFYDRLFLLRMDYEDRRVSKQFMRTLVKNLTACLPLVDIPLMLLIEAKDSIERLQSQRDEGLDYSLFNEGLDFRENTLEGLDEYHKGYKSLSAEFEKIRVIDSGESKEKVFTKIRKNLEI